MCIRDSFWWQNQNSKTTFIVQTFPKYCRKGFYFMKLSLLSPILAKFQFCWFSGLFWAFFPCKKDQKWNRIFTAEEVLKSKKWRKQTHIKIQFPMKIQVCESLFSILGLRGQSRWALLRIHLQTFCVWRSLSCPFPDFSLFHNNHLAGITC